VSTLVITIFVRHKPVCKYAGDEFAKQCRCRKHLRWSLGGKQFRKQAGTRSWAEAEDAKVRLIAQLSGSPAAPPVLAPDKQTIRAAVDLFVRAKEVREISSGAVQRYRTELERLTTFCENAGVFVVEAINPVLLLNYKATWPSVYKSTTTRLIVQKRLSGFLHFCKDNGWLKSLPKLDPVRVTEPPTLPISDAEYQRLLKAAPVGLVRAIIQLMRWSGLAVRDASCLKAEGLLYSSKKIYQVLTARQKSGVQVYVPIPTDVATELLAVARKGEKYLFWNPAMQSQATFSSNIGQEIAAAFRKAKIHTKGHMISHRLRDSFAVHYLSQGVPMEEVSKMLGHESVATTEKHYAQWAKGRQDRVDALVTATWKK
jgi:integrase/recombinase XerD